MLDTKTKTIGLRISSADFERTREAAAAECRSVSSFVLFALRRRLDELDAETMSVRQTSIAV